MEQVSAEEPAARTQQHSWALRALAAPREDKTLAELTRQRDVHPNQVTD